MACEAPAGTTNPTQSGQNPVVEEPLIETINPNAQTLATALAREAIENAQPGREPQTGSSSDAAAINPLLVKAQILLDRAKFSPGVIDGLGGDNTRRALEAFQKAQGVTVTGEVDTASFEQLVAASKGQVLIDYVITRQDVSGPFLGDRELDMEAMAALDHVGYRSALEGLAEKFHMTEGLLKALNPGADFTKEGQKLVVAAVSDDKLTADVAEIRVSKAERSVRAYDAQGKLLAFYPATIGSNERPAPTGEMEVINQAPNPNFTYDPSRVTYGEGKQRMVIQPGPNNPVGTMWIGLSRDTYGIHGTPDPSKVGKTFSSGCIRLTNWDANQLASRVRPGVKVVIS